jgi:hypothetical protein
VLESEGVRIVTDPVEPVSTPEVGISGVEEEPGMVAGAMLVKDEIL